MSKLDGAGLARNGGRPPMNFSFVLDISGIYVILFLYLIFIVLLYYNIIKILFVNLFFEGSMDQSFGESKSKVH